MLDPSSTELNLKFEERRAIFNLGSEKYITDLIKSENYSQTRITNFHKNIEAELREKLRTFKTAEKAKS